MELEVCLEGGFEPAVRQVAVVRLGGAADAGDLPALLKGLGDEASSGEGVASDDEYAS